jgi:hypothetical protein
MKRLIVILLFGLLVAAPLVGDWYWNKYTGKLDYYERSTASPWFSTLYLYDIDLSNRLAISWPENDILDRTLRIYVNSANRIINLGGDLTLSGDNQVADWTVSNSLTLTAPARNLKTWWNFEEFIGRPDATSGIWFRTANGTGSYGTSAAGTSLRPGILSLGTGTTDTGYSNIMSGGHIDLGSSFLFGAGVYTIEGDIYIGNLSSGTETYAIRFGFGDSGTGAPTDGAFFYYSDAGANPNWYRRTVSNTVLTSTDTGVAAVAGAWIRLKIVVNADATSVEFFINDVSVGSNVANIPSGVGRNTGAVYSIIKSAGTTDRAVYIDWVWLHIDLTASR